MTSEKKWKIMAGKLALSCFSFLLFGLLAEVALQIKFRVSEGTWLWQNNAYRIHFTQPVDDRRQYALRAGYADPTKGITVNEHGFRSPTLTFEQPWIAALGDSVPFGAGVRDEQTYAHQLNVQFESAGKPWRVLNAGVPSYNLRQSFDRLFFDVIPKHGTPDLILIQASNDISLLTHYREEYNGELTWAEGRWENKWKRAFTSRLALGFFIEAVRTPIAHKINALRGKGEDHAYHPGDAMLENVRRVMREALGKLEAEPCKVVVISHNPFYYQTAQQEKTESLSLDKGYAAYRKSQQDLPQQFNEVIKEVCSEFSCASFFDLRAEMDAGDREGQYSDFIHYSPAGNTFVAEKIAHHLEQQGLLIHLPGK